MKPPLLHISPDLMIGAPVKEAADQAGFEHRRALSMAGAMQHLDGMPRGVVLVDLDCTGFDLQTIGQTIAARGHVVAVYGPHVRTDLFDAAAAAGITHCFTRGMLAGRGAETLRSLYGLVANSQHEDEQT